MAFIAANLKKTTPSQLQDIQERYTYQSTDSFDDILSEGYFLGAFDCSACFVVVDVTAGVGWLTIVVDSDTGTASNQSGMPAAEDIWVLTRTVLAKEFGASPTAGFDNASAISAAMTHASDNGVGVVYIPAGVYEISNIVMKANVALVGPVRNGLNVQDMAITPAEDTGAFTLRAVAGSTGNLITFNENSKSAGIVNCIVDASNHTGDVVLIDGNVEVRHDNYLRDVTIWEGTGKQISITANNNETLLERVYCRGGLDRTSAVANYGVYDLSQDSKFVNCWFSFHKLRGIFDASGAGRRIELDSWGCQSYGTELSGASGTTYTNLKTNNNGLSGIKLASAQRCIINGVIFINNNKNATTVDGDCEVTGDCRGTIINGAQMRGTDTGVITNAFYQIPTALTGISVSNVNIATSYTNQFSYAAEAYWNISNATTTQFPYRLMRANQINPNLSFAPHAASAPTGWQVRSAGVSAVELADVPTGYHSAAKITSGVGTTSGIQYVGKTVDEVRNTRVRIKALVKGSGATSLGNQFLQIFDGVTSPKVDIPNNATWTEVAIIHNIPDAATNFQVRLVASNTTTAGLILYATAVTIEVY